MADSLTIDFLNVFVLYALNISQPVRDVDVASNLGRTSRFVNENSNTILHQVRKALVDLTARGYVHRSLDGQYYATSSGIQLLTDKRIAFPRDKHRLYYLKEALRRRG